MEFSRQPDVNRECSATLARVISSSPYLIRQLNSSVRGGELERIELLRRDRHAGGSYDAATGVVGVQPQLLTPGDEPEATFVLGHELRHALDRAETLQREIDFLGACESSARTSFDYTVPIERYLIVRRQQEASANLAGWNAMMDWIDRNVRHPRIDDVAITNPYRAADFVDHDGARFMIKPGLAADPTLRFALSPQNVEAMAGYYFDVPPTRSRLGFHGTSDYQNQYGAWAVTQAASCHRYFTHQRLPPPTMIINTRRLGLSRRLLEENGIDLDGVSAQAYLDASTHPPQLDFLHHTVQTHRYVAVDQQLPKPRDRSPDIALRTAASSTTIRHADPTSDSSHRDNSTHRSGFHSSHRSLNGPRTG